MKTIREHLESAHDELVAARKIAALSKHDSYTDIGDAIECVEAALVWGGDKKQQRLVRLRCCVCSKVTETAVLPSDPPETFEIRGTACPKCDHGGWDSPTYHREDGFEIELSERPNAQDLP